MLASTALAVAGCVLALLLGEQIVRWFVPQHFALSVALRGLHRTDRELGYVMVPGFTRRVRTPEFACDVRTNSLALRDRELNAAARYRVLVVGDSFTLGVHAGDSCFVEQMEHALDAEVRLHAAPEGGAIECVNAGVEGYGTVQEVGLFERLAPLVQPDVAVLAFYLGNDFTDNSGRTRMTVVDGYQMLEASAAGYRAHFAPWHRRARLWLHAHSELYLLLKARLLHPLRARPARGSHDATTPQPFDYYVYDKGFAEALAASPSADLQRGLDATRTALQALQRVCAERAIPALVVALPAAQQVDPEARNRWISRFGLQASALDFERPNRRLATIAAEIGLPFLDLTPVFAAAIARGEHPYLDDDPHWNVRGHTLAARALLVPVLERMSAAPVPLAGRR
jgi:hypothetical protein